MNVRSCYHHRPTPSGALRVLPAASGAESRMFLVRCFSLGSSQMASPSLGIWRKLYSRTITGQQTARACPARKERQPPNISRGSSDGYRDYWTDESTRNPETCPNSRRADRARPGQHRFPGQVKRAGYSTIASYLCAAWFTNHCHTHAPIGSHRGQDNSGLPQLCSHLPAPTTASGDGA